MSVGPLLLSHQHAMRRLTNKAARPGADIDCHGEDLKRVVCDTIISP